MDDDAGKEEGVIRDDIWAEREEKEEEEGEQEVNMDTSEEEYFEEPIISENPEADESATNPGTVDDTAASLGSQTATKIDESADINIVGS